MSDERNALGHRPLSPAESGDLGLALDQLAWDFARRTTAPGADALPVDIHDAVGDGQVAAARLARLAVYKTLGLLLDANMRQDALTALARGADTQDVATALGVTRQAVKKRLGDRIQGPHVAVVIARRDKVYVDPGDSRGSYGEVGGVHQYESDRRQWAVGKQVRDLARYAIVGVDGEVRRVYALDPAGWREVAPRMWEFTAVQDQELTQQEINTAYQARELPLRPGDPCPTRAGGAYRPHWF